MAVKVTIINPVVDESVPEGFAALELKRCFEKHFNGTTAQGTISIVYGLTLRGQSVRDVDIAVVGNLDNAIIKNIYTNSPHYKKKDLSVKTFCTVIELKGHTADYVSIANTHVYVKYKNQLKDATEQNEKQRYALGNYLERELGYKPIVTNLIWLSSISQQCLSEYAKGTNIGVLPATFSYEQFIEAIIAQGFNPTYSQLDHHYVLSCVDDSMQFERDIKNVLLTEHHLPDGLTRRKMEMLTQTIADGKLTKLSIGEKLTVFKGRAGTGKTISLLETALSMANPDSGIRCLLLTYNQALVNDIRRMLHFMNIPDGIDSYTVQVETLHSFFISLMQKTIGVKSAELYNGNFETNYQKALKELYEYVTDLMDDKDIKTLKEDFESAIDWDYILIDEGQDWADEEKNVLYKIYGSHRLIIADGGEQYIRSNRLLS